MAEIATIARPYAEALFSVSQSGSNLEEVQNWLEAFALVAQNADFLAFAGSPKTTSIEVIDLMLDVAKVAPCGVAQNFLEVVVENRRLSILPEVASQFKGLKNAAQGVCDAIIYSAFPVEEAAFSGVLEALERRFSRKLIYRVVVDEALIGGIRVVVGDEVFDTSVRSQLEQMRATLVV